MKPHKNFFPVKTILMDVDGTMTATDGHPDGMEHSGMWHLETLMMETHRITRKEANKRILACDDLNLAPATDYFEKLGVSPQKYFDRLRAELKRHSVITGDTIAFFKDIKAKGIPIYTATTNPRFMTLVKLSVGGISDINGCDYIAGYHPGCEFRDPEGKYSSKFYSNIVEHSGCEPEYTMMIGDEPIRDMIPAMKAGIKYGVNVDRKQKKGIIYKDGGIFVNSLELLIDLIVKG